MTYTVLITGANRGIGLEFVKQFSKLGWNVFACCRDTTKANELSDVANSTPSVSLYNLDVSKSEQIDDLANQFKGKPIDLVLNNAGIFGVREQSIEDVDMNALQDHFLINTTAPLLMTKAFLDNVRSSELKTVMCMSSILGSIASTNSPGMFAYRSSKAAANMITKALASELNPQGIRVVNLHPGWVQTDMGGGSAPLTVVDSVKGLIDNVILDKSKTGLYYDYTGKELPW